MDKKQIKEAIEKGYIRVHVMFEVVGNPKAHVEKAIKTYIAEIKKDPQILVFKEEYAEPVEKDKLWSTFCEADLMVLGLEKLNWLCINYTPASIELIEPDTLTYRNKDLTIWANDLLSKLHEIGIITKSLNQKNKYLEKNISMVIRNCILALVEEDKTVKQISKALGLSEKNIQQFLNALDAEGKIKKKGTKYVRVSKHAKK
ncbi:MAG: helix-turn-helix domain-containing protein [Nanoarchaeota archaeon]|nr:helix-turn-helix domain-containing protein [Nanoarchaeota archaeon]